MSPKEAAKQELIGILAGIRFAERYYGYYEHTRSRARPELTPHEVFVQALASTGIAFSFDAREKFFRHREKHGGSEIDLHVAFTSSSVEFILAVKTPQGQVGGPFSLLARQVELRREPAFTYSPPYPKLMFSTSEELDQVVQFGVSLFQDIKSSILARREQAGVSALQAEG